MAEWSGYKGGELEARERMMREICDSQRAATVLTREARDARRAGLDDDAELLTRRAQYWWNKAAKLRRQLEGSR